MKKKLIILSIIGVSLYGLVALIRWNPNASANGNNVTVVDGTQYIDLTAKGGYAPQTSTAKAGMPTVLKVTTNGTYDCSAGINIPTKGISQYLPASGTTQIALGTPTAGTLQGTCSMGMYHFAIDFQG